MTVGARRFARQLLDEHTLPPELAEVGYEAVRAGIEQLDGDALSELIRKLKAQPYRRGEDRKL